MTNERLAADRAALPAQELLRVLMELEARLEFQHRFSPFFMRAKKLRPSVTAPLFFTLFSVNAASVLELY